MAAIVLSMAAIDRRCTVRMKRIRFSDQASLSPPLLLTNMASEIRSTRLKQAITGEHPRGYLSV